jgi:hypothetical protein
MRVGRSDDDAASLLRWGREESDRQWRHRHAGPVGHTIRVWRPRKLPTTSRHPLRRSIDALIDAQAIAGWRVPAGMTSHVHEFDAKEGGSFRISLTNDSLVSGGKSTAHTDT